MIGGPIKKTYASGFLGVGDSVGQVKATTGGGVVFGGLCAKIAGKVAVEAIDHNDFSEQFLKKYHKMWTKEYLQELRLMKLVRLALNALPDKLIDELFYSIEKEGVTDMMEDVGDMDMQGELIKRVLFGPKVVNLLGSILFGLFKRR